MNSKNEEFSCEEEISLVRSLRALQITLYKKYDE